MQPRTEENVEPRSTTTAFRFRREGFQPQNAKNRPARPYPTVPPRPGDDAFATERAVAGNVKFER